jgi:hypothetical protein
MDANIIFSLFLGTIAMALVWLEDAVDAPQKSLMSQVFGGPAGCQDVSEVPHEEER